MRMHYLQHVPFETPAYIGEWAKMKGHTLTGTHLYCQTSFPDLDELEWLVILGGPMNIYQEEAYPWLAEEKAFIKKAIEGKKLVLGICLGAQLIADVLGGKVTKNQETEIGWLSVEGENGWARSVFQDFPQQFSVFQWHNDTFSELGVGCENVMSSVGCCNQALVYQNHVVGIQFHLESTERSIRELLTHCAEEMKPGQYVQSKEIIIQNMNAVTKANLLMKLLLERMENNFGK